MEDRTEQDKEEIWAEGKSGGKKVNHITKLIFLAGKFLTPRKKNSVMHPTLTVLYLSALKELCVIFFLRAMNLSH